MTSQSMPTEVLALIFEELDCSKDRSMVSQSCKLFQEIVEPLFYGEILQKSNESTSLLLRSILYNRPLANLVKRFSIYQPDGGTIQVLDPNQIHAFHITHDWPNLESWLGHCLKTTVTFDPVELERRHISESELCRQAAEVAVGWRIRCLDVDNWDALTAALLTLLPNLERIDISRYDSSIKEISKVLYRASLLQCRKLDTEFSLLRLTEIRLGESFRGTDSIPFEMNHLITALGFQSLKTLIVFGITDDMQSHDLCFPTQAQHLTLWHCGMAYNHLHFVLKNCVALRELRIGYLTLRGVQSRFIPGLILGALEHSKETLEIFKLIDENGRNHTISPSPLPRITHFTKLHTVEVVADLLLGQTFTDVDTESVSLGPNDVFRITDFPQSIELLVFREMRADLIQYIMLSADWDSQLPNLKVVRIEFISEEELKDNAEWLAVVAVYDKYDIAIVWSFCGGVPFPNGIEWKF